MYRQFFGLNSLPFRITPDTLLFYAGGDRGALLDAISYAVVHGEGMVKIVGEVGSGKTMLSRMLTKTLPEQIHLIYLLNPSIQADEVIFSIAHELGLRVSPDQNKIHTLHAVQAKLLEMHADNKRAVVFIDEAQKMPLETLEELRLLSNLETDTDKLLQIVLFGQPELDEHINSRSVRQIKERITQNFYLAPLGPTEVNEYLSFRLHKAGYNGPRLFSSAAGKMIYKHSNGLLRRITILADKSLLAAFSEQSREIKAKHVRAALKDNESFSGKSFQWLNPVAGSAFLVAGLCIGLLLTPGVQTLSFKEANATVPQKVVRAQSSGAEQAIPFVKDSPVAVQPEATGKKLLPPGEKSFTIQIMSAIPADREKLKNFLHDLVDKNQREQMLIKSPSGSEQKMYALLYGQFSDFNSAQRALKMLPPSLKRFKPFITTSRLTKATHNHSSLQNVASIF